LSQVLGSSAIIAGDSELSESPQQIESCNPQVFKANQVSKVYGPLSELTNETEMALAIISTSQSSFKLEFNVKSSVNQLILNPSSL
jgi:hypothetical protein